jgi:membrane protease subunit (stomatin/prohibitin family)
MVNLKYFTNLKWGTSNPVAFRDSELGLVRLRAHGIFNIQVVQPVLFINSLVGTMEKLTTDDVESYLKRVIVSRLNDYLGEKVDTLLNLPGKFDAFSLDLQQRLTQDFAHFGLRLTQLYITSITPPDEVQKAIDDQSRMNAIRDMDKFIQMKAAMAIEKAAGSQGEAGAGAGMGMGLMLPGMFANAFNRGSGKGATSQATMVCPDCAHSIAADARFCPLCGHQQLVLSQCGNCGKNLSPQASFCSRCGEPAGKRAQATVCSNCKAENLPHSMFCNQCGERIS